MAHMIPDAPPEPGHGKAAERVLYEALASRLPDDFFVYHGLRYLKGERALEGEADFLVLHRERGLLCVECKGYSRNERIGARLWKQVQERLAQREATELPAQAIREEEARYGEEFLMRARLGQGAFRVLVTEAYTRKCAITGERTLHVLQAAHIKPFAKSGPHRVDNGLLLRSNLHTLFDRGYVTVTPEHRVEVSRRIREEYENGRDYYVFHAQRLMSLPRRQTEQPGREFLNWHNNEVFLG